MNELTFTVFGKPQTAGSKRAFRAKSGKLLVVDDNKDTKSWQAAVRDAALDARPTVELYRGPLAVEFTFYRARGSGHFGTGRNAGQVKASAPLYPDKRPDVLKLARAVEDALTGVLWYDDAQIVQEQLAKEYGEPERVEIRVQLLPGTVATAEQPMLAVA